MDSIHLSRGEGMYHSGPGGLRTRLPALDRAE